MAGGCNVRDEGTAVGSVFLAFAILAKYLLILAVALVMVSTSTLLAHWGLSCFIGYASTLSIYSHFLSFSATWWYSLSWRWKIWQSFLLMLLILCRGYGSGSKSCNVVGSGVGANPMDSCGSGGLRPVCTGSAGGDVPDAGGMAPGSGVILVGTLPVGGAVLEDTVLVGGVVPVGTGPVGGAVPVGTGIQVQCFVVELYHCSYPSVLDYMWEGILPVGAGPLGLISSPGVMFPVVLCFGVRYASEGVPGGVGVAVKSSHGVVTRYGTVLSPKPLASVLLGVRSVGAPNWLSSVKVGVLVLDVASIWVVVPWIQEESDVC